MNKIFERTKGLIGSQNLDILNNSHIIVFGVGGVGGYCVEALARAGIGEITIVDNDIIDVTNINRQIIATEETIGMYKVRVFKERLLSINKCIKVNDIKMFYLPEKKEKFDFSEFSYVIDAVDNITAKIDIISNSKKVNTPVISCMGMGNKLNPQMIEVDYIHKTSICPLAKVVRKELAKRDIKDIKAVYSRETPTVRKSPPGSISFVPSVAGLIMAGEVINSLIDIY